MSSYDHKPRKRSFINWRKKAIEDSASPLGTHQNQQNRQEQILQLQNVIGNQAVMRMLKQNQIQRNEYEEYDVQDVPQNNVGDQTTAPTSFKDKFSSYNAHDFNNNNKTSNLDQYTTSSSDLQNSQLGNNYATTFAELQTNNNTAPTSDNNNAPINNNNNNNAPTSDNNNKEDNKYSDLKTMIGHDKEKDSSVDFTNDLLKGIVTTIKKNKKMLDNLLEKKWIDMSAERLYWYPLLERHMGWKKEVADKYLGNQLSDGWGSFEIKAKDTKVKYLNENERENYEVTGGGTMMQGQPPYVFDTSNMYSKFKGAGFGIFVMSSSGKMYSSAHQVGLFHHSSFLSGGDIAGAGEMKVEKGQLKHITNKSGHYFPSDTQLLQSLYELRNRGVSLAGVNVTRLLPGNRTEEYAGDAVKYINEYENKLGASDPNNDNSDVVLVPNDSGVLEKQPQDSVDNDNDNQDVFLVNSQGRVVPQSDDKPHLFLLNTSGKLQVIDKVDNPIGHTYFAMGANGFMQKVGANSDNNNYDESVYQNDNNNNNNNDESVYNNYDESVYQNDNNNNNTNNNNNNDESVYNNYDESVYQNDNSGYTINENGYLEKGD